MSLETISFHKRTFFPSSSNAFISNYFNPNEIFFASGSKLVLYDFILSKKNFRINTNGSKIIYLKQYLTDQDKISSGEKSLINEEDEVNTNFKNSNKQINDDENEDDIPNE